MFGKFRSFAVAFIALAAVPALAVDGRARAELSDIQTASHVAQVDRSAHSHAAADHAHSSRLGHRASESTGSTHRHRHAPGGPVHEHQSETFAFFNTTVFATLLAVQVLVQIFQYENDSSLRPSNEKLPSDSAFSSLLRPPIASVPS